MTDVKALRALINAATPSRPWETYPLTRAGQGYGIGYATEHGHKEGVCEDRFLTAADATLIAAAVNALPELLDEVERLDSEVSNWASGSRHIMDKAIATIRKLEADIHDLRSANPTAARMIAMQKELARLQSFVARTVENAQLKIERLQLDVAAIEIERDALRAEVDRLRARKAEMCDCVHATGTIDEMLAYINANCSKCDGAGAVAMEGDK